MSIHCLKIIWHKPIRIKLERKAKFKLHVLTSFTYFQIWSLLFMFLFHKGLERLMYIIEGRAETNLFSSQKCRHVTLLSYCLDCINSLVIWCETFLPFFLFRFKADGKNCGPGPRQLKVRLNSQIYLVCPNLPTVLQQRGHDVQTSNMKENIWLLHNKTAFDECDVSHCLLYTSPSPRDA